MRWQRISIYSLTVIGISSILAGVFFFFKAADQSCLSQQSVVLGSSTTPVATQSASTKHEVGVDIAGAVKNPGFYSLEADTRLGELISAAGGLNSDVDKSYVSQELNLSQKVEDQAKVYIPSQAEKGYQLELAEVCSNADNPSSGSKEGEGLVSLNFATQKELETLPGIGEKRATDIIAGRPYQKISELVERTIITQTVFDELKDLLKL